MLYFLCKKIDCLKVLFIYFKRIHDLPSTDTYRCCGCFQTAEFKKISFQIEKMQPFYGQPAPVILFGTLKNLLCLWGNPF